MLDKNDKKILVNLLENSRVPLKELSKRISLSREVINYRIKRLENNKIILHHTIRLNLSNFAIGSYTLLLKFKNYDNKHENEIINFIKTLNYTHMIGRIGGEYDLFIGFSVKQINDLDIFLTSIYNKFPQHIDKHLIYTDIKHYKSDIACILDNKVTTKKTSRKLLSNKIKLDKTDKNIISELTRNSKQSYAQIAHKLNLSPAAIIYRIKNLEKQNIIIGYRSMVNVLKLDKQLNYLFFNINSQNENKMIKYLRNKPEIIYVIKLAGNHSYLCLMHTNNNFELYDTLKELKSNISDIKDFSLYPLLEFLHHNYLPLGFLE